MPPAARSTAAIASASTAAAGPSVWIVSCAAPGVGGSSDSRAWTAARDAASISSMIAGCTPEAVTAADASAAVRTSGKVAAIVHTSPGTRRRSFSVAPTMTPSVPSEPITSDVRSSPVTPFTVRWPRRSSRPSASTRSTPSTASRTTPYFAHSRPPAPVAMLPPTVEIARLAGIGCPPQTVLGERGVEVGVEDAGLDDREQVVGAHLEDAIHRAHRQRDLARSGVRAAGEAGARAARHDGCAGLGRDPQRRLHVLDRAAR